MFPLVFFYLFNFASLAVSWSRVGGWVGAGIITTDAWITRVYLVDRFRLIRGVQICG